MSSSGYGQNSNGLAERGDFSWKRSAQGFVQHAVSGEKMAINHSLLAIPKPPARKRKKNHSTRNKRRKKGGMVKDLDKLARKEIVEDRDQNTCQRCNRVDGTYEPRESYGGGYARLVVIQWGHVHTRRHHCLRWDEDNSLALCDRCHKWFDNNKVLGFDWFAKKFPERMERILRVLQSGTKTTDAWVRSKWEESRNGSD